MTLSPLLVLIPVLIHTPAPTPTPTPSIKPAGSSTYKRFLGSKWVKKCRAKRKNTHALTTRIHMQTAFGVVAKQTQLTTTIVPALNLFAILHAGGWFQNQSARE